MTTLEHQQIKGITIKNVVVTLVSTASIVASVTTTYYGLKSQIQTVNADRITETRLTNLRLTILENEVTLLQKQVNEIKYPLKESRPPNPTPSVEPLLTANK